MGAQKGGMPPVLMFLIRVNLWITSLVSAVANPAIGELLGLHSQCAHPFTALFQRFGASRIVIAMPVRRRALFRGHVGVALFGSALRLLVEREDLVRIADILLRVAVAVETPDHVERLALPGQLHLLYRPMTDVAVQPPRD